MSSRLSRVFATAWILAAVASLPVRADLLLHYDFNDDSDPNTVVDQSGNDNDAQVMGAMYTEAGLGRSGGDDDIAMDFLGANDGAHIDVITAIDGAFDTINQNDAATIAMWLKGGPSQPHDNSAFWFSGDTEARILQAHIPWSNSNIYFDVGGCCDASQRINAATEERFIKGRWNHWAFVKDETQTRIYQNGELFLESAPDAIASIEFDLITNVDFGSAQDGGNSYNGLMDDLYVYDEALTEDDILELAESDLQELLVEPESVRMRIGDTRQLQVTLVDGGVDTDVTAGAEGTTYSADPAGIVTISADGLVTGVGAGEVVVTVTNGALKATASFIVDDPRGETAQLLWYDFNDDSDPQVVVDGSGNDNDAEVFLAEYTEDGEGVTGAEGDRAMNFGDPGNSAYINVLTAMDGAFQSINENDAATVAMWILGGEQQPVNQTNFRFEDDVGTRVLSGHIPWSNSNIYFDVGGCCATATPAQRINTAITPETFKGKWNHYAFVKDGTVTRIYQNGLLLLESGAGAEMVNLADFPITQVVFGSVLGGGESYHGLIDNIGVWDGPLSDDEIEELATLGRDQLVVSPTSLRMREGEERQLQVTLFEGDGTQSDVTAGASGTTYSSDPAGVVSISADGLVTGESEGEAEITVENGGILATVDVTVLPPREPTQLLLCYDFNDPSDPEIVPDQSGNDNDGEIILAEYTEEGMGWTGEDGDYAMNFLGPEDGAYINVPTAFEGAFETINENDAATIALWTFGGESQPHNNSAFWFSGDTEARVLQAHIPWSNSNIYFDVGGCCDASQRINAATAEEFIKGQWNHYAFVKDGTQTRIYQNGELFLESAPGAIASIEQDLITAVAFGSAQAGGNSYNGLLDDIGVWDGALSQDEIIDVMEDGVCPEDMPKEPRFTRGDANADGAFNISDGTFILNALFAGGPDPTCTDAADANSDGGVNIADGVYVLNALFGGGDQPGAPFPDCGEAPAGTSISCDAFEPCP